MIPTHLGANPLATTRTLIEPWPALLDRFFESIVPRGASKGVLHVVGVVAGERLASHDLPHENSVVLSPRQGPTRRPYSPSWWASLPSRLGRQIDGVEIMNVHRAASRSVRAEIALGPARGPVTSWVTLVATSVNLRQAFGQQSATVTL